MRPTFALLMGLSLAAPAFGKGAASFWRGKGHELYSDIVTILSGH